MADKKTSNLDVVTTLADADHIIGHDTTPTTFRITWANVKAYFLRHALAVAANDFLVASGAGVFVKKTLAETLTILGKAAASGLASLDASSLVVQNPAGATATPTASKIPIADANAQLNAWVSGSIDGWIAANQTWTYASATTITVPSGAASIYSKGDKIKLTQTTVKYFYVVTVADTVLTVTGGSNYTVADAAISANFYSKAMSPLNFPQWFAYAPAISNETDTQPSIGSGTIAGRFALMGRTITGLAQVTWAANSTTGTGVRINITPPIAASANVPIASILGVGGVLDAGTQFYTAMTALQTTTKLRILNAGPAASDALSWATLFTPAVNDQWSFSFAYEI